MEVLTIEHSTHSLERFVDLLRRHDVALVADVRLAPGSRRARCPGADWWR